MLAPSIVACLADKTYRTTNYMQLLLFLSLVGFIGAVKSLVNSVLIIMHYTIILYRAVMQNV